MPKQTDGSTEAYRYRIVPIGSANPQGWAIERDGKLSRSGDRLGNRPASSADL
jgi:hypothetical protein